MAFWDFDKPQILIDCSFISFYSKFRWNIGMDEDWVKY